MRQLSPIAIRRFESAVRYDLRYGEPLLDLPLISAWRRELARAALRSKLQYPPANGLRVLREAIVEYLARRRGVTCSAADIVIVNGTQQAINLIARLLINSGDTAVVEDPHYQFAVHALKAHGTKILSVATDRDGLTCEQLPQQAPRLVYVTPSNQFPSGAEMSVQRRLVLLAYAARQRRWIVEDDYDGEFRYDAHTTPALRSLDMNDRVIYVGTFSKVLFPALRLGYMVCPSGLRNDFVKAKQLEDLGSATIEQLAMASFMQSGAFDRHLRKATMELRRRRTTLLEGLQRHCGERIEIAGSNAGMHLVGWLPRWPADRVHALVDLAEQHGLGLHPIEPYYAHKPKRAGLLLGYASMSANQLRVATRIFGECLGKL